MRVLITSVEGTFCPEIESLLSGVEGITLVRENPSPEATQTLHDLQPDLVLLDLDAAASNPAAVVARLGRTFPDSKIVVLSAKETEPRVLDALRNGAQGHLVKGTSNREEIVKALHAVTKGASILSPVMAGVILDEVTYRHRMAAAGQLSASCRA